jgi:hypothetical protein
MKQPRLFFAITGEPARSVTWIDVFAVPIAIGLLAIAGLLTAPLFDRAGRIFSWAGVASPLLVCVWAFLRKGRTSSIRAKRRHS